MKLRESYGYECCADSVYRMLKKLGIKVAKPTHDPIENNWYIELELNTSEAIASLQSRPKITLDAEEFIPKEERPAWRARMEELMNGDWDS